MTERERIGEGKASEAGPRGQLPRAAPSPNLSHRTRIRATPCRAAVSAPADSGRLRDMPPARDLQPDFFGSAGTDAMMHGARFLAPLTKDGPISVGRSH
eukprot:3386959-Prymnesium_polylepis.1